MSTCKLPEAFQRESLDVQILRCLEWLGSPNISQIANMLGVERNRVKSRLRLLKAEGYVKDRWNLVRMPFGNLIRCHEWQLRRKGKHLLRGGGPLLQIFKCDGSLPAWNPKVQPTGGQPAAWLPPRGDQASEVNWQRAEKAAGILHAFSIAQRSSRPL